MLPADVALGAPPPAAPGEQQEVRPQGKEAELVMWLYGTLTCLREETLERLTHFIFNLKGGREGGREGEREG